MRHYMQELHIHGMLPGMSRPANPYDNATCESLIKTLKREEIRASAYREFEDLRQGLEEFIERYYTNRGRSVLIAVIPVFKRSRAGFQKSACFPRRRPLSESRWFKSGRRN